MFWCVLFRVPTKSILYCTCIKLRSPERRVHVCTCVPTNTTCKIISNKIFNPNSNIPASQHACRYFVLNSTFPRFSRIVQLYYSYLVNCGNSRREPMQKKTTVIIFALVLLLLLRTTHTLYNDDVDIFLQTSYINERDHTKVIAYSKKYLNN